MNELVVIQLFLGANQEQDLETNAVIRHWWHSRLDMLSKHFSERTRLQKRQK